ncbi:uncharacterized protein CMC5_071870 [Chondromyces crocatus]|uniref:Uncharacterized protein n=1 Tax=Chondromyces crocatus TaxID=52 RepID=A0A0K1EQ66_CHOCO|nr:uncharacterized protein CMC5_071870 [Chondromyces crocatus]
MTLNCLSSEFNDAELPSACRPLDSNRNACAALFQNQQERRNMPPIAKQSARTLRGKFTLIVLGHP